MNEPDDYARGYTDGASDSLVWSHSITAHMLDCPEARKSDIVSQTPEYKIGYVEALVNTMTAIDRRLTDIKQKSEAMSHDHSHHSHGQDHNHEQQSSEATADEPSSEP
jgi:hypothetical protein